MQDKVGPYGKDSDSFGDNLYMFYLLHNGVVHGPELPATIRCTVCATHQLLDHQTDVKECVPITRWDVLQYVIETSVKHTCHQNIRQMKGFEMSSLLHVVHHGRQNCTLVLNGVYYSTVHLIFLLYFLAQCNHKPFYSL